MLVVLLLLVLIISVFVLMAKVRGQKRRLDRIEDKVYK